MQARHRGSACHQNHLPARLEGHLNRQRQLTSWAGLQARQIKLGRSGR